MGTESSCKKQYSNRAEIKKKGKKDMCSRIIRPSKPKNILTCENCNKQILFYQKRICNSGGKIPYGQDGKPHQCPNVPANKELRCSCQLSIRQYWESESSHIRTSESVTQIHALMERKTKTIIVALDSFSRLVNYLRLEVERVRNK
jgi:hypothetical protein